MNRITLSVGVIAISVLTVTLAVAQQSGQQGGMQPPSASSPKPAGPHDHDAHHAQHMEMCRQMMSQGGTTGPGMMRDGMMGPGMMGGMMPMMGGDPKQQAEMMAMRGEMMKAMGDIMLKYAQRAQSAK
jgi:hypothetical protein